MIKISMKSARVNKNLTVRKASDLIGVSFVTLNRWEMKRSKLPEVAKAKICEVYEMPIEMIDWEKK